MTSGTSARTDYRGGGGEARHSLGTGVFGQVSLAANRVTALHWQFAFSVAGKCIFGWYEINAVR